MSESAVNAAVEVAAEHGLRSVDPVVLRDSWHVLVHLRPLPLVARVSSGLPYPDGPPREDGGHEVMDLGAWRVEVRIP